jgi:hypothetical protein
MLTLLAVTVPAAAFMLTETVITRRNRARLATGTTPSELTHAAHDQHRADARSYNFVGR